MSKTLITLRRTFNQKTYTYDASGKLVCDGVLKFWRVTGPLDHRNFNSDLSLEGLREWGILQ